MRKSSVYSLYSRILSVGKAVKFWVHFPFNCSEDMDYFFNKPYIYSGVYLLQLPVSLSSIQI